MMTKEDMEAFDQTIREAIEEQQEKIGLSDEKIGKMAFGFMPAPRMKVQAIKRGQGAGENKKPQNLRFADVVNLCEAVGLSWQDVGKSALRSLRDKQK